MRVLSCTLITLVAVLTLILSEAHSHSGGTNAQGCHTNRKTGEYHCHNRKAIPPNQITYCHVVNGERRCGYARRTCDDLASRFGGYCERQ